MYDQPRADSKERPPELTITSSLGFATSEFFETSGRDLLSAEVAAGCARAGRVAIA
jgi:hypothetical protein